MYFKRRQGPQKRFLVWENIVLIRADSSDDAYDKADQRGREEEAIDDETMTVGGRPSRMVFAGVRKITECADPETRPADGAEVTYNEMTVKSEAAIKKLAAGKAVSVEMRGPFPEEEDMARREPAETTASPANGRGRRVV
jgi:hypothetical protein